MKGQSPTFVIFLLFICFSFFCDYSACAEVITIQSVYLKNSEGQWVKIIEPDKQVDLEREEPGLSFFNNGRIPAGSYVNFRLHFLKGQAVELTAVRNFEEPINLKNGSFVGVWFSLAEALRVSGLTLTVDEDTRKLEAKDMALTPSTMVSLGTQAPSFELTDVVSGKKVSLSDFKGRKALLVMFICRHCPFVQHVKHELAKLGKDYAGKDLAIVAISANDAAGYPDDAPASLKVMAKEERFNFPFLYDETQAVARAYGAVCTPDFFLYGPDRKLVYRGQLDDSRPSNGKPVTGKDLRFAIDALLAGKPGCADQKPSVGCNIKWKPGSEPKY